MSKGIPLLRNKVVQWIIFLMISGCVILYARIFHKQKEILSQKYVPRFSVKDIKGMEISHRKIKKHTTYIQFVNPVDPDDIDVLNNVYDNWINIDLNIIIITRDIRFIRNKDYNRAIIISRDYDKMRGLLLSPMDAGTYHIIDKKGYIVNQGYNREGYENRIKYYLNKAVLDKSIAISEFIDRGKNVAAIAHLKIMDEIIRNTGKKYYIFSLHTKICGTCSGGEIINILKRYYKENQNEVAIIEIVHPYYDEKDIFRIKKELEIGFPVYIADEALSKKWNELISQYTEIELTNIVIIVNKTGIISNLMYPGCNCAKTFIGEVEKYIYRRGNNE